jgi:PAS domain S-box-containing protein
MPDIRAIGRYILVSVVLALVYYGAARLGLRYASIGQSISLVWPPTGIAFAALVLLGKRYWPGVALGAFLANAATPVPLAAVAGIATGNTLEALLAAFLLSRVAGFRPNLEHGPSVRALILQSAPLGALVSAVVGVTSLWAAGQLPNETLGTALPVWWAGDLLGALVVAPLILSWTTHHKTSRATRGIFEILALCIGTAAAVEIAVGRFITPPVIRSVEYPFLLFPFVIWAALRFGARGVSLLTFVLSVVAVSHTVHGGGPFLSATPVNTMFAITAYLSVVAITGLSLAAAVTFERDRASRALGQSQEQLRRSLDAARMGIWTWTVASNVLVWDENLRQLYGLRPGETVTGYDDFIRRVHPDDRAFVEQAVRNALERGGDLDYEFRIVLPDGRIRWIADQGHVVRDDQGQPVALSGICLDVTERRLSEERIRHAHRMESVGRLAGGVAHEANNQMSVVLGASSFVLMNRNLPAEVRADVELIQRAAERTASVTAQLLAFSRRQVMNPRVLDLNQLIQGWEPLLRRVMGEDCSVTLQLGASVGSVRADPGQLQQACLNLAINARDAMPKGGHLLVETYQVRLTEEYARRRPDVSILPGGYAVLAVTDTGRGIDRDTLDRIFEPFFTTKSVGQGTGLGLSTVYGIVKQSGGYIWAYSEPGQGSTFKLYFPITPDSVLPETAGPAAAPRGMGERVLLVEDEEGVRAIVTRALSEAGYRVLEADSGEAALELLANDAGGIDLLLTDIELK